MTDVFDTISSEDREKVEKLADIVRKSPFYKQWANYYGSVAEPYPVDTKPRTATVSFLLCGDAFRKDGSGERKTLATDIRVPRKTAPNYSSFVMREAARLMSDAADPNDPCDGFSPDRVEIVAIDTGDTYKFNL